jgi:nitroreductase
MDLYDAIRSRTSIRKYRPDPIPEEALDRILDAMRSAPSACNNQPWHFVLVQELEQRGRLAQACRGQSFLAEAPLIVVGCGREPEAYQNMGGYWNSLAVDLAIALDHLTLAAAAEGLGTCWIGAYDEDQVRAVLGIPPDVRVIALLPVGYPAVEPRATPRKSLDEIVYYDRWSE